MNTWVKQNGTELELNDQPATIEHAKRLKWKLKSEKKAKSEKKEDTQKAE